MLVAISLRPAIVSIGPLLPKIIQDFELSHWAASLLTGIPALLMGTLALPTPWLAKRFGRNRVLIAALSMLFAATLARAFSSDVYQLLLSTLALLLLVAGASMMFMLAPFLEPPAKTSSAVA